MTQSEPPPLPSFGIPELIGMPLDQAWAALTAFFTAGNVASYPAQAYDGSLGGTPVPDPASKNDRKVIAQDLVYRNDGTGRIRLACEAMTPINAMILPGVGTLDAEVATAVIEAAWDATGLPGEVEPTLGTSPTRTNPNVAPGYVDHTVPGRGTEISPAPNVEIIVYEPIG